MRSDEIRTRQYGQGGSTPAPIRLRGVQVGETLQNRRLKWQRSESGASYVPTNEEITFFCSLGNAPVQLENGAEAWVLFRPAADRYEQIGDMFTGHAAQLIDARDGDLLIGSNGTPGRGTVIINGEEFEAVNKTGVPIWAGSELVLAPTPEGRLTIIQSNASHIIWGAWDGSGNRLEVESYGWIFPGENDVAVQKGNFNDSGMTNAKFKVADHLNILGSLGSGQVACFATGGAFYDFDNTLICLNCKGGGSGGGDGFPWPGPGTDPNPGTATVSIIAAKVNEPDDVGSGDATFAFDGGTAIIGTAAATGTAANTFAKGYCDNEDVLLISTNGAGWETLKVGVNIILANVDESGGVATTDGTFDFDGAVSLEGQVPSGSSGIADNDASLAWNNNEQFWAIQKDNGKWWPIKIPKVNILKATVNQSGGVRPADGTYAFDSAAPITGSGPATGTANNTYVESYADNEVVTLIQRADNGQWETLKKGDCFLVCKGTPSAGITRTTATITCNAPTVVQGKIPVGAIEAINNPELKATTSDTIYFVFDLSIGTTNANRWTTAHPRNHILILRGYTGYAVAADRYQGLVHGDTDLPLWMDCTICNPA